MLVFDKRKLTVNYGHYSRVLVPFSNNDGTQVSKFLIMKQNGAKCFMAMVWDTNASMYEQNSYRDCNSKTLKETIEKVSAKYSRGGV